MIWFFCAGERRMWQSGLPRPCHQRTYWLVSLIPLDWHTYLQCPLSLFGNRCMLPILITTFTFTYKCMILTTDPIEWCNINTIKIHTFSVTNTNRWYNKYKSVSWVGETNPSWDVARSSKGLSSMLPIEYIAFCTRNLGNKGLWGLWSLDRSSCNTQRKSLQFPNTPPNGLSDVHNIHCLLQDDNLI